MSAYEFFPGDGFDVALSPRLGISFALENDRPHRSAGNSAASGLQPGTSPTIVQPDLARYTTAGGDIMPWGEGNDFPQRIFKLYNKSTIIPATLGKVASMLTGRGIMAVLEDINDDGEEIDRPLPQNDPVTQEILAFITSTMMSLYLREMAGDAAWFFNGFPEMIISKNRQKIVQMHPLNAEECRWARMDEFGNMPYVYVSADWPHTTIENLNTKRVDALDPHRWDRVDWVRDSSFYNVVYPISYPTPGTRFYSLAHHYSIVESGWMDVHLAVPSFKKYLMKNQMSLKYHVKVDKDYWKELWGDKYTMASDEEKLKLRKSWIDSITKMLTDVDHAATTLVTTVQVSLDGKVTKDFVTVTPVTDSMKDGKYIEDNLEASAQILYALNVDPTLVGYAGGQKMGARSGGSDKQQAYLIALEQLSPFRGMLIEPLEFVAEFNGWKRRFPNLRFRFRDQKIIATPEAKAKTKPKDKQEK
ncbi:hypothetical protein DYU11_21015 [Fibrisoma montanum]|uniref:Phage portal protein n=1 Tax=Fibrisoma montanum TaxID=2305895 RepID=A0A418M492_9BACT|nr:hypothetical protein [Fibrisoma montanum]RIV20529.1 hypothetical protein DYU11_21015 [Fibrisoma montanum]